MNDLTRELASINRRLKLLEGVSNRTPQRNEYEEIAKSYCYQQLAADQNLALANTLYAVNMGFTGGRVVRLDDDFSAASGGAWSSPVGTWALNSNALYLSVSGGSHNFYAVDIGSIHHRCAARFAAIGGTAAQGIFVRYTDTSNYIRIQRNDTTDQFDIYQRVAGVDTLLGSTPTMTIDTTTTIKAEVENDTIRVSVNSGVVWRGTHSLTATTGTYCGIYSASGATGTTYRMDDFSASVLHGSWLAKRKADGKIYNAHTEPIIVDVKGQVQWESNTTYTLGGTWRGVFLYRSGFLYWADHRAMPNTYGAAYCQAIAGTMVLNPDAYIDLYAAFNDSVSMDIDGGFNTRLEAKVTGLWTQ